MIPTIAAHAPSLDEDAPVATAAILTDFTLSPDQDAAAIMRAFEEREADEFIVTEDDGTVLGVVSERYVRRRYTDEIEKAQRELFGE